ncbi:MAG: TauD/TfdA family dioxygenase [Gammaproteobacteria bacterium]|nr:TauD/TfdA family dioxygenase [Gammaproteobacteria bacterium]
MAFFSDSDIASTNKAGLRSRNAQPMLTESRAPTPAGTPFDLGGTQAYETWRGWKFADYPKTAADLIVEVRDPLCLTVAEHKAIIEHCYKANMALYACLGGDIGSKETVARLGQQFGLRHLDNNLCADNDSITSVRVMPSGRQHEYIPYSDRPLRWHTDGYYNRPQQQIQAFIMHCVRDADSGGENALLDPEIVYLLVRDENPAYVRALMQPDAMTIPANVEQGIEIRGAESGPVFSVDTNTGALHMRYTARRRSILWKNDPVLRAAVCFLEDMLSGDCPYILRHCLKPGQGLICNNVLHTRAGFKDDTTTDHGRLLYRARYYDRIVGT